MEMQSHVNNSHSVYLVECPRDAMQGWKSLIPTKKKIEYINALMQVGFDVLDFGSFVSAKAIPQMADTKEVISKIDFGDSKTKLLAIIANLRGAREAAAYDRISYLGFPFSVSPTFQLRNTNSSISQSLDTVDAIRITCAEAGKELVVYISMAFGNPYGDAYSEEIVYDWVRKLTGMGIRILSLSDTVGLATPDQVFSITDYLTRLLPDREIGAHLHSSPENWQAKVDAALKAGCRRFDGALKGIGGCPMAEDELVGNLNSELLIPYFEKLHLLGGIHQPALEKCKNLAAEIFAQ
jgi:hydroxymethylglutaryl-CoA lyase